MRTSIRVVIAQVEQIVDRVTDSSNFDSLGPAGPIIWALFVIILSLIVAGAWYFNRQEGRLTTFFEASTELQRSERKEWREGIESGQEKLAEAMSNHEKSLDRVTDKLEVIVRQLSSRRD